jgi:hypothetical protein
VDVSQQNTRAVIGFERLNEQTPHGNRSGRFDPSAAGEIACEAVESHPPTTPAS